MNNSFVRPHADFPQYQLILPTDNLTVDLPKNYTLNMGDNHQVTNTFVFTEPTGPHPKPPHAPGFPTGKATSIMATIKHECAATPQSGSAEYREIMKSRNIEAAKKGGRSVQILGDDNMADPAGGRGGMFLPGVGIRNGFIVSTTPYCLADSMVKICVAGIERESNSFYDTNG